MSHLFIFFLIINIMYKAQRVYYEKNKEDLRNKARQKYHDNKRKNTVFTIEYGEFYPFQSKTNETK